MSEDRDRRAEVDGGGGLADAALLVDNGKRARRGFDVLLRRKVRPATTAPAGLGPSAPAGLAARGR